MRTYVALVIAVLSLAIAGATSAGEGRGRFVRIVEQTIEGQEHLGIVVRPMERDEPVTLLVPPPNTDLGEELRGRARRFREGQIVEFAFREDGGRLWARDIRPAREGEGDRPDRREAARESGPRGENVERQLAEMREEIVRLRRELEEMRRARGDRESPERRDRVERRDEPVRPERGDREIRREGPRDEGERRQPERRELEERRDRPREEGGRREGEMRGTFVRRTEVRVGDYEFLAIVVRPAERDEPVTFTIPRRNEDLNHAARQLREGQEIGIVWVEEEGQRWLRRLQK